MHTLGPAILSLEVEISLLLHWKTVNNREVTLSWRLLYVGSLSALECTSKLSLAQIPFMYLRLLVELPGQLHSSG